MNDPLSSKREEIDRIDEQILGLLEKRAVLATEVFIHKSAQSLARFDPQREEEILNRIMNAPSDAFPVRARQTIFSEILSACRNLSGELRIGILGEKHGWVHDAAVSRFGSSALLSALENSEELLDSLLREDVTLGFFPMISGSDLLLILEAFMGDKIKIAAETRYLQRFSLYSPDVADLGEVNELFLTRETMSLLRQWVVSMPSPVRIMICRSMVEVMENMVEGRQVAGLIPEHLTKTMEGKIIRDGLEPYANGPVRCLTISTKTQPFYPGNKASILCHLPDDPEALPGILAPLSWARCPLHGIESFRFHHKAWKDLFLIDFTVPETETEYQKILDVIARKCRLMVTLGQYPVAEQVT